MSSQHNRQMTRKTSWARPVVARLDRAKALDSQTGTNYNAPTSQPVPPACLSQAQVAQLVEHVTENHGVGGSIPPLGTIFPQE